MRTPTLEEVKYRFKDAKKVESAHTGLKGNIKINTIRYNETDKKFIVCDSSNYCGITTLWSVKKGYAKILTYKKPKQETFQISKEQILSLEYICISGRNYSGSYELRNMFPKVFEENKVELEAGNWYKWDDFWKGKEYNILYYITKIENEEIFSYGFKNSEWIEDELSYSGSHYEDACNNFRLADHKEVEEALRNEAVRRGYKRDVVIVNMYNGTPSKLHTRISNNIFDWEEIGGGKNQGEMALRDSNGNILFHNGIWATIIPTKTRQEAEKELNCKIVD